MNEQVKIILVVIFAILFLICIKVFVTEFPKEVEQRDIIQYTTETVKTNLYVENMVSPQVSTVLSERQLSDYGNAYNDEVLHLKLSKYTSDFFKNNILVVVTIQDGSSSISNTITDVKKVNNSTINIIIEKQVPEILTADMAMSHLVIEMKKVDLNDITTILVNGK